MTEDLHPERLVPPALTRQVELMQKARQGASFDPRQLTYLIFDGEEAVKRREAILTRVEAKLNEANPKMLPRVQKDLNRTSLYHEGLRFGAVLMQEQIEHGHGLFNRVTHHYTLVNASPFGLHPGMFIPTLKLQASPEQLAYWLPLAESGKIIGSYCQTELGHGTFVRGLETTATFDPKSDEFILHSPTITSTKYWPGGIGYSSSHAIVMARLIIAEKDHGVHPFLTQLRSLDDFRPVPGVELGDIGLTMGLKCMDNGYAIFNQVRIPRLHMLMGNARVMKDGTYIAPSNNKQSYSTMIYARNLIVETAALQLAQAATIAIRYSVVREQGNLHFDSSVTYEVPLISYKSQHYRLLTIMSRAFAILFASKKCETVYQDLVSRKDDSSLTYGHITTAALKAYASQTASDGAEDARKCCGGHGYSSLSGLPDLVADVTSMATLEGENYVMYQQAARYLMKCASAIRSGNSVHPSMAYLTEPFARSQCTAYGTEFLNPDIQLSIFRHRSARLIFECDLLIEETMMKDHSSREEAWNTHMMSLITAARAHAEYFVLQSFIDQVSCTDNIPVRNVLKHLCDLFALTAVESPFSIGSLGFFEDSYISAGQLREIRSHVNSILLKLIPEAVGLTDAWNFSDASLQSAIGQKDGNVYETLLSWTRQLPLNQMCKTEGIDQVGFRQYIKPILHGKL